MSNASHLTKVTTPNTNVGTRGSTCADLFARTALVTAMIMAGVANAQTWTGATDTDWNTASNWTGGTPAAADDAVINTGTGNQPTLGVTTPGLTSTSVSAGTLAISNSGNLVSTDVNISGSGAIENAGVITGAVSVSDTGTLTNNGGTLSGPLTLNNSGSFRATTSGTIGNLRIGSSAAATISAATGTTLTQTGAFNSYVPSGSVTFGSAIDTGRVVMTANGGAYGLNFSVNVAGGTLAAAGSQFAGLLSNISSTSVAAGATLDIGSIDTTVQRLGGAGTVTNSSATDRVLTLKNTSTFAGAISDGATNNLSLVRIGTGTTTLTGASGYTGSTTVAQGTLALGAGSSLASTSVTIDAGAVLSTNGEHLADGTTLSNNGQFTVTGAETIGEMNGTGAVTLTDPGVLTIAGAATATISNAFNGSGGLTFTNAGGAHTLNGTNSHTGATTLEAGGLTLSGGSAIADTGAVVVNGGILALSNSETIGALSGTGGAIQLGSNTLTVNATNGSSGYDGAIGGTGGISKTGAGTLALSGTNTYSGGTTIDGGTISISAYNNLGTGALTLDGGTLQTTSSFTSSRSTTLNAGGGTFNTGAGTTLTQSGQISGAGSMEKIGTGALLLTGNNTYTGSTQLSGGNLTLSGAGALASTDVTISAGGTLTTQGGATTGLASATALLNNGLLALTGDEEIGSLAGAGAVDLGAQTLTTGGLNTDTTFAGVVSGVGSLQKVGTGTLLLSGVNTYSGGTTVSAGTLQGNSTSLQGDILNNATVSFDQAVNGTYAGAMTGSGSLIKTGASTLLLSGVNTYSGGTTVSAGTLQGNSTSLQGDILNHATVSFDQAVNGTYAGAMTGSGSLIKTGASTLLLSGVNTYSGGTTVSAGTLQGNSTSLQGDILNHATVSFDQAVNGTYAGAMTGSGSLIKTGASTLLLSGVNTYSGGTTVSAGTLQGNSTSLQGNILNNAMVSFDQAVNGTYAGAMTGSGSLIKSSAGTLLLSGANTYSGGTTVSAGTLQGNSTSLQGDILNNAMVSFDQAADGVYAGAMSGTGGFIKSGAGRLTFSGGNTYTGNTTINDGTLAVNGSLAGDVQVNNGGRLQGTGSVGSVTLVSGGVYAPGNSIGTQVVNGDLAFNGGSIYEVETDPTGAGSDLIQVNGVATLAGQVQHIGESGTYRPLSTYTILSATGGFAGTTFEGATSDYAFLTPTLTYDLNNVYLGLLRNDVAVADFGQTSNQIATASALDSLPTGGALQIAILGLTNNEVPGALNALSGELYASANSAVLQNSQEFSQSLLQRSGNQLDEHKRTALPLWIETESATRRNEGDSNTAEAIQRDSSVAVGGELAMPNDWILGVAFRYGDQRLSVDDRSSHADIDSYSFGLYGRWAQPLDAGVLRMTLGGIYGIHSIDAERGIYTTGMRQSLSADYDATSRQVFAELGYAMDLRANIQLEPYVGISWTQVANDSFTEKGGNAALHGDSQNEDMTASTLGLRSQLPLSNGQFQLDAGLGWQHNFSDVNPEADLNFAGSSTFTVEGAALARDTAMLDLGASYRITPAITVRAGYSGQFGDNVSSNGGNLTFTWEL